jgi:ferredoxin
VRTGGQKLGPLTNLLGNPVLFRCFNRLIVAMFSRLIRVRSHVSSTVGGSKRINFSFINRDGSTTAVKAPIGKTVLEAAHENGVELEGACEGSMACSTCHVILEPALFEKLEEACEREEDLLDLAPGLTDTSRLSCQIKVDDRLEGCQIMLPKTTLNFYVDGHIPKPH